MDNTVAITIVKEVFHNYLFAEFNEESEKMITELTNKLQPHYEDVKVNLSFTAANGDVAVDIFHDGIKEIITISKWSRNNWSKSNQTNIFFKKYWKKYKKYVYKNINMYIIDFTYCDTWIKFKQ